jgi:AraC-like DNA-binding protein
MTMREQIEAVARMQDHIRNHLMEEITLIELARTAGYSPWHSARLFREHTGKTPFEYIRMMRLTEAAKQLREDKRSVLDLSLDFLFSSHEGFTKAFSKAFGVAPLQYRRSTPPIPLFLPTDLRVYHFQIQTGGNPMKEPTNTKAVFVQIVERPKRKLLLRRGIQATEYFEYCEEVGCDVWGVLTSVVDALYEPIGLWLPNVLRREGTSEYVQGVEVPLHYDKPLPDGFELIELPAGKVMIFQGEPYADEDFMEAIMELKPKIDAFDPSVYGYEFTEDCEPRFQLSPMGYRGYIEGRPVRPLVK